MVILGRPAQVQGVQKTPRRLPGLNLDTKHTFAHIIQMYIHIQKMYIHTMYIYI
jgi:hypothetical protein